MPQKSRPDPSNGTIVNADEYEGLSLGSFTDGVIGDAFSAPVVYADSTGRQVKIRAGQQVTVRGYSWWSDPTIAEIVNNGGTGLPANTSGFPRIDRLVLRLDRSTRTLKPVYLQGTPASGGPATPPALTQDVSQSAGVWDFPLARWTVPNGYTTITAASIVNESWYRPPGSHGILCTSTSRPFGNYLHYGMEIYEYDTTVYRRWTGTSWMMTSPYRQEIVLDADAPGGGEVTFSNIPTFLRTVRIAYNARSSYSGATSCALFMRVNGVASGYYYVSQGVQNQTQFGNNLKDQTYMQVGHIPVNPGNYNSGVINISGWDLTSSRSDRLTVEASSACYPLDIEAFSMQIAGVAITPPPWTSLSFYPFYGPLGGGSRFLLEGWD